MMTDSFAALVATSRYLVRIRLSGELDDDTAPLLVSLVRVQLEERPDARALHLDCAALTGCDALGLSALLSLRRELGAADVVLSLERRRAAFDELLERTGTLHYLTTKPDAEQESTG